MSDVKEEILKDFSGEAIVIHRSQDCTDIIENNKSLYNDPLQGGQAGRKCASVPIEVLNAWIKEGVDWRKAQRDPEMMKKLKAKLNAPENRFFKTRPGVI